jgi:radical SAM protein with 4Fe4S-binding SPASM domain
VLARLAALGIDELMISLDGPEGLNDNIRGRGAYRKAWDALCMARELGLPLRVNTVVMKSNITSITGFLNRTVELGVKTHSFFHFTPVGAGKDIAHEAVPKYEWLAFLAEMGDGCRQRDVRKTRVILEQVYVDSAEIRETDTLGCRIAFKKYCQVLCDGFVSPCTFLLYTGLFLGNVAQDSLSNIWRNPHSWKQYDEYMSVCRPCARYDVCKGGCWLYSYYHDKTFGRDPRCDVSDSVIPICPYLKRSAHGGVIVHSTADASEEKRVIGADRMDA